MEQIGYVDNVDSIYQAVISIYAGRKGWATKGKEPEGRVTFEYGITKASYAFKEAETSADPQTLILAEYTFICQELELCSETDKETLSSLSKAKQDFDDAFLALQVVENSSGYKEAEKTYPHRDDYRIKNFPKDAFHTACISHRTRLNNIIRVPGVDPIEKSLLKQRIANLKTAQNGYMTKQKKTLA